VLGAAVEEVVAVDHREHHVREIELGERARRVLGLARIDDAARISRGDRAEAAAARARLAEDHDRRGALAPALADVGAARLFADGVEIEPTERALERLVPLAAREPDTQPVRLLARQRRDLGGVLRRRLLGHARTLRPGPRDGNPGPPHTRRAVRSRATRDQRRDFAADFVDFAPAFFADAFGAGFAEAFEGFAAGPEAFAEAFEDFGEALEDFAAGVEGFAAGFEGLARNGVRGASSTCWRSVTSSAFFLGGPTFTGRLDEDYGAASLRRSVGRQEAVT
jgi:hypothetical protein